MAKPTGIELIVEMLKEKAGIKHEVGALTQKIFNEMKQAMKAIQGEVNKALGHADNAMKVHYDDKGSYEASLSFGGDLLIFTMHTNVFTFDVDHFVYKSAYVQEDPRRSYCGVIQLYNFLSDSFRFNRVNDVGYLIGRIFINRERHFFVEGKRQLGFLYNDFENAVLDAAGIRAVIESAMLYCIDFELLTPPYTAMQEMTVQEKMLQTEGLSVKTGKRLGFRFQADTDRIE